MDMADGRPMQGFGAWSRDGVAVVTAPAEVSAANAGEMWETLAAVTDDHVTVIVDMAATSLCSLSGLSVLVRALQRATASRVRLRLVVTDPALGELFTATGAGQLFAIFDSLAAALGVVRRRLPETAVPQPRLAESG